MQRGFQILSRLEIGALQRLLDPAFEPLDQAVGLQTRGRGQSVLDAKLGAKLVEIELAIGLALAKAEQTVGRYLGIVGQNRAHAQRAGLFQITQKAARVDGCFGTIDADEHPARCPVDRHEQLEEERFLTI